MKDTKTATAKQEPDTWELHSNQWPDGSHNGRPYIYAPSAPDGHRHVMEVFGELQRNGGYKVDPIDLERAAAIVRDHNAHAGLVAALEALTGTVDRLLTITCPLKMGDPRIVTTAEAVRLTAAVDSANAAIRAAKGEA